MREFLLLITKNATTAARNTTPPTTPAIIGIKETGPGPGDGVEEGGLVAFSPEDELPGEGVAVSIVTAGVIRAVV